jgi:class 3 adenylate cyclase
MFTRSDEHEVWRGREALPIRNASQVSVVGDATIRPGLPAGPRDPLPGAAWREVTVLHVDLAGVARSERIAPATVALVMSERLRAVVAIAAAWGGIVDGYAGGCASIVFSLPHAGLQQATAGIALEAALEVHLRVGEVSATMPWRDALAERRPRISIASGPCVVAALVCNTRPLSTAIGPAVDAARRLQASAAPGVIVCDHPTWLLVQDHVLGRAVPEPCAAAGELRRYEISGFSSCDRPWRRTAAAVKCTTTAVTPGRVLRREGDYWTIHCGESAFHFKDSKGFRSLARLLATPHVEIHVLELARVIADSSVARNAALPTGGDHLVPHEPAGPVLDGQAKAEYRERLRELDQEIDEAQNWGDAERAARAEAEKRTLARQLASALGLGGRDRKLPSPGERARVNLTRTIRAAIDSIAASHPDLGAHLRAAIRTGTFCSYSPHPGVSDHWHVEQQSGRSARQSGGRA